MKSKSSSISVHTAFWYTPYLSFHYRFCAYILKEREREAEREKVIGCTKRSYAFYAIRVKRVRQKIFYHSRDNDEIYCISRRNEYLSYEASTFIMIVKGHLNRQIYIKFFFSSKWMVEK